MKGHMTGWLLSPGSGRWVNRSGSILRANEHKTVGEHQVAVYCTCLQPFDRANKLELQFDN